MSLGVGAVESLMSLMMQSLNYIHSRNSRLALIWAAGGVANSALGIASTTIVAEVGNWRWYIWVMFFISAASLVLIILFVPETSFPRSQEDLGWFLIIH